MSASFCALLLCAAALSHGAVPPPPHGDSSQTAHGSTARSGAVLGAADTTDLWPQGKVPYYIETEATNPSNPASYRLAADEQRVLLAVAHWEAKTCIRFVRCDKGSCPVGHVVFISDASRCYSPVGMAALNQILLAEGCGTSAIIHEIGHTLGLTHEHSRNDRDAFIYVDYTQIISGMESNFDKRGSSGRSLGAYDYGSIMHYGPSAFDKGSLPTIVAPVPIGQRGGLSAGDVETIHFMYNGCAAFVKPRCITSHGAGKVLVPHSKTWEVEFNGLYSSPMVLSYGGTAPASMRTQTVSGGATVPGTATSLVTFTPGSDQAGQTFTISATFTSGGLSATCSVQAEVAMSSLICFGVDSVDPRVCGGRGTCTNNRMQPCQCNAGYGGTQCLGYADCPANIIDSFDTGLGMWSPLGVGVVQQSEVVSRGSGALLVGGETTGQAQLQFSALAPKTITFDIAWYDSARTPTLAFRNGDLTTCFSVTYYQGFWRFGTTPVGAAPAAKVFSHFELSVDWDARKTTIYVDGDLVKEDVPIAGCSDISRMVYFGNGYLDECNLRCTAVPTPAPDTSAPPTSAPDTPAPATPAPPTSAPDTSAPPTSAPNTPAPDTSAPPTSAPDTPAPATPAPSTPAPPTFAPDTPAPNTPAPPTPAPDTSSPPTPAPATPAPRTSAPAIPPQSCVARTLAGPCRVGVSQRCTLRVVHPMRVLSVAHSPDGAEVATGAADGVLRVFSTATGALLRTLGCVDFAAHDVAYSPDGVRVAAGGAGGRAVVCNATSGELLLQLEDGGAAAAPVRRVRFSDDGRLLVAGGVQEPLTRVHRVAGGVPELVLHMHTRGAVGFVPGGAQVAAVQGDVKEAVRLFALGSGQPGIEVVSTGALVTSLSFAAGELARGMDDGTVRVGRWDGVEGEDTGERLRLEHGSGFVHDVQYSPDGRLLAAVGQGQVRIWAASSGAAVGTLIGHPGNVLRMSFSPDGALATVGDGDLLLWDMAGL